MGAPRGNSHSFASNIHLPWLRNRITNLSLKFVDRPPPWELRRQAEKASAEEASKTADAPKPQQGADTTPLKPAKHSAEETSAPVAGSSSSKPTQAPPPHPILKKSRGDSKSGPRPTARFVVPDVDDSKDDGEASSGSASTAGTDTRKSSSPAKSEKRKTSAHTKRFHASIGTKRRPALPRRISSQSSTASDSASKEDVPATSRHQGAQHAVAPIAEQSGDQSSPSSTGSTASPRRGLSAKAAGKRPAPKQPAQERIPTHHRAADPIPTSPAPDNSREKKPVEIVPEKGKANLSHDASPVKLDRTQSTEFRRTPQGRTTLPRSQSHIELKGTSMSSSKSLRRALAAEPTASTTTVAALGTIIDINRNEIPWPGASTAESPEAPSYRLPRGPSATSLLETRLMPTPPSATPEVPLARTKSQLTLLLEREKGRLGDKPRSKH